MANITCAGALEVNSANISSIPYTLSIATYEGNANGASCPFPGDQMEWGPGVVTAMVRQIPRHFTQQALLQEVVSRGFEGLFDFLYLPYDTKKGINVGYGFVNFTDPRMALSFRDALDGVFLDKQMKVKGKPLRVHPASVQGYQANFQHFAHTKTGQKQDPLYSPMFFPGTNASCLTGLLHATSPGLGGEAGCDAAVGPQSGGQAKQWARLEQLNRASQGGAAAFGAAKAALAEAAALGWGDLTAVAPATQGGSNQQEGHEEQWPAPSEPSSEKRGRHRRGRR